MESKKNNSLVGVLVFVIIVLLGLVGYLGYNLYAKKGLSNNEVNTNEPANNNVHEESTTKVSNSEIKVETLEGENTELSKIINDYIGALDKTVLEKQYNITKVAHVVAGEMRDEMVYDIIIEYYVGTKKIDIKSEFYEVLADTIKNYSSNSELLEFLKVNFDFTTFKDLKNSNMYFLISSSYIGNGYAVGGTNTSVIFDSNFNKIGVVNAMISSSIWNKDGSSILSQRGINIEIINNKIYSLAHDPSSPCDFVEYETYIENGNLKQNKIKMFLDTEVDGAGEKC